MLEPDMTSTGALAGVGEEAGDEDWSRRLLERDMTSTGRPGEGWSRRLLELDMTSPGRLTGREGD